MTTLKKSAIVAVSRVFAIAGITLSLAFFGCSSNSNDDGGEESSSSSDKSSSSNENQITEIMSVNKFEAQPTPEIGNDRIKYSYSYGNYDFYYIYLGELRNIPLYGYDSYHYDGESEDTKTYVMTESLKNTVLKAITESSQNTIGIVEENTLSATAGIKLSQELSTKVGVEANVWIAKVSAETEIKVAAEESFSASISNKTGENFQTTKSLANTVTEGTEYTKTNSETTIRNFTKNNKAGWYRYTLFSASDVYLYVIKNSTGVVYYEFKENIIVPISNGWRWDYSETLSFKKSDATSFEFDISMLDNLPKPSVILPVLSSSSSFSEPSSSSVTTLKIDTIQFVTVGTHTYDFNKKFPATIEIYAIGAGGGGQGGHDFDVPTKRGTGAGGGGGAGAYIKFTVTEWIAFGISVGKGGKGGGGYANVFPSIGYKQTGGKGDDGENTIITWDDATLTLKGGTGGGGAEEYNLSGGNGGVASTKPILPIESNWFSITGNSGADGIKEGETKNGGDGVTLNIGSYSDAALSGGNGGSGGYNAAHGGEQGGDGKVVIIVTYPE